MGQHAMQPPSRQRHLTPFGAKLRRLRQDRGITQARLAQALGVSAAWLSALEHGRRAPPSRARLDQICVFFNLIWDEAEELAALAAASPQRVSIPTADLPPEARAFVLRLAADIRHLKPAQITALHQILTRQG